MPVALYDAHRQVQAQAVFGQTPVESCPAFVEAFAVPVVAYKAKSSMSVINQLLHDGVNAMLISMRMTSASMSAKTISA